jgi:hypothetical protein
MNRSGAGSAAIRGRVAVPVAALITTLVIVVRKRGYALASQGDLAGAPGRRPMAADGATVASSGRTPTRPADLRELASL